MTERVSTPNNMKSKRTYRIFAGILRFTRRKPLGAISALIFVIAIFVALLSPWITPYDPIDADIPVRLTAPSAEYLLGTDHLGRDVLSRIIEGTRVALLVGAGATFLGITLGLIIGVVSAYAGGRTDMYIQRLMDVWMAFPSLILALAIMAVLGSSIFNVILAIALSSIPRANRVVRSVALTVKSFQFVEAARAVGASPRRIVFRHILPNCLASYLILFTSMLGGAILIEASLSFLGLGVPPPAPSWGRSLSEAMNFLYSSYWLAVFPGVAISVLVFSANMFGDALRDVWDPRLKQM